MNFSVSPWHVEITCRMTLPKPGMFPTRFLQRERVRVGLLPQEQEVFVRLASGSGVVTQHCRTSQSEMGKRIQYRGGNLAPMIQDLPELGTPVRAGRWVVVTALRTLLCSGQRPRR
jgi:hypothetical protein